MVVFVMFSDEDTVITLELAKKILQGFFFKPAPDVAQEPAASESGDCTDRYGIIKRICVREF